MALILVVDDEAPLREFVVMLVEELGHRTGEATNGDDALRRMAAERPDLVLSDVMMPIMGGVELARRIKGGTAVGPPVPVILMSAAGRAVANGSEADGFLDKPFELGELEDLLRRWLPAG